MSTSSYVCPRCRKPVSFVSQGVLQPSSYIYRGIERAARVPEWPVYTCGTCGQYICNPEFRKVPV